VKPVTILLHVLDRLDYRRQCYSPSEHKHLQRVRFSRSTIRLLDGFVAVRVKGRARAICKYCLYCEVVELISDGRMGSASIFHLSFRDHVHNLNAGQKDPGTAKRFESQHGPRSSLDRPMVLLDQIIEIFGLVNLDGFCCGKARGGTTNRYAKYCLYYQFVELICGRGMRFASTLHLSLAFICISSMPASRIRAQRNVWNPSTGRVRRLIADGPARPDY
jgi:hypothetical protein